MHIHIIWKKIDKQKTQTLEVSINKSQSGLFDAWLAVTVFFLTCLFFWKVILALK